MRKWDWSIILRKHNSLLSVQPFISIIIPVYNVEPYLRQCLESVVNQTIHDLQIICVNDGSTDSSLAILEEYAERDNRFFIVNQENQGGGSARNAALPFIRGQYTYFLDPDDLIHLQLCEKTVRLAEEHDTDAVYFRLTGLDSDSHSPKFDSKLPRLRATPREKSDLIAYFNGSVLKLWRSEFLLKNDIRFSDGKRPYNDIFQNWKGCVLAGRIAVLDETLYYRRNRPGSYQQTLGPSHFVIIDAMNQVGNMLHETGRYNDYETLFLSSRIDAFRRTYFRLPAIHRPGFRTMLLDALTDEDRSFIESASKVQLSSKNRMFGYVIRQNGFYDRMKLRIMEIKSELGKWLRSHVFFSIKKFKLLLFPQKTNGLLSPENGTIAFSEENTAAGKPLLHEKRKAA